jgi:membrane protein YqaA with SNARE-associated domain
VITSIIATLGYCFASAALPFVNSELYLLAAYILVPPDQVPLLVIAAGVGAMGGKAVLYLAGSGALRLPSARLRNAVDAAKLQYARAGGRGNLVGGAVVLFSAMVGLPPFYPISIMAGALRFPFWPFMVLGLIGRTIRFGALALVPGLFDWVRF